MKTKNSILSFLRHLLSSVGTVIAYTSPDPTTKIIAGAVATAAAGWGVTDEYKAENGKLPTAPAGIASVLIFAFALLGVGLGMSGCATLQQNSPDTNRIAAYTLTKNATLLVLQKEPAAEVQLTAIAQGIDVVFSSGELTPEQLKASLDALKVSPKNQLLIASALTDAYNLYVTATGKKIVVTTDPTATAILKGVQSGIQDGIAFAKAFSAAN